MRTVVVNPLGVVRRAARRRPPGRWPGVLVVLGVFAFMALSPLMRWLAARVGLLFLRGSTAVEELRAS